MQACRAWKLPITSQARPCMRRDAVLAEQRRCESTAVGRIDYLRVLGLSDGATPADVKQAYYHLSLKLHPDRNPGDEAAHTRFVAVLEAYERLNGIARNPVDMAARLAKERESTWKTNTSNLDDIMRRAKSSLEDHYHEQPDDPATQPAPEATQRDYRLLTTQLQNIGLLAGGMLLVIAAVGYLEKTS